MVLPSLPDARPDNGTAWRAPPAVMTEPTGGTQSKSSRPVAASGSAPERAAALWTPDGPAAEITRAAETRTTVIDVRRRGVVVTSDPPVHRPRDERSMS